MFGEVYKKYVNNFKIILPFILMRVALDSLSYFGSGGVRSAEKYDVIFGANGIIRSMGFEGILIFLFLLLISPIIYVSIALLCKKILKDEEDISFGETLRESTHYYFRYIGLSLIIGAVVIGISLLMVVTRGLFFLLIPAVIFLIYFAITVEPCIEYLIHNDSSVEEAFSGGRKIGKKYFWSLFGLDIIIGVLSQIFRISFFSAMPGLPIMSLFTAIFQGYTVMFRMNLCTYDRE